MSDRGPPDVQFPELKASFEHQRASPEIPSLAARRDLLDRLERLLRDNGESIAAAIAKDFGVRSRHETQLAELFPSLEAIRHARRHVARWMRPERRSTGLWFLPARSQVLYQPLGVVGIVVPWNYPLYLAIGPAVSALAAGNRVMVKMSESVPATGELLARLVAERFDPASLTVVNGGPEVARAFCALPFDHLLFTGSTAVGRQVMRAAAENLTPVTLELGGKSPAILGRDFPIAKAVERILFGKCLNAGQTCIAPDYVLVPEERIEEFVSEVRRSFPTLYPHLRENPDYTAIVNARQKARLEACLADAVAKGARWVELNPSGETLAGSLKLAPGLLLGVNDTMDMMRQEIFGPFLPVVGYRDLGEAIAYVNARPRPLALYVFDHDGRAVDRVLAETVSGGACVNDTILHVAQDDLPFGGVGASGMGRYHGHEGFRTFSHAKAVFRQSRWNGVRLFNPPYGKRFEALAKLLLG
jgi:acyl-CoA reductase-like NAD-dependent aldehyde dehydrogenase